ncbi:hypothetical protein L596_020966 [Steinernema carpocapsae]|uniref:Uncharacterized protein n=1 Tax=Steinernema carpocapsae TaxID=34508 RepID=A0A4U5MV45_STECR|nr:hypothetical protein L596_020966 [Steinernema carpocapsae]
MSVAFGFGLALHVLITCWVLVTVILLKERNHAFNVIKHSYIAIIHAICACNAAYMVFWGIANAGQSQLNDTFLQKSAIWVNFGSFSSTVLFRSLSIGTTLIKIKKKHSWAWTPQLLQAIAFAVIIAWLACSLGFGLSVLTFHYGYHINCQDFFCLISSNKQTAQFTLYVDTFYLLTETPVALLYVLNYKASSVIDPNLQWSKEKIAFFEGYNKMYLIITPAMSVLITVQLMLQAFIHGELVSVSVERSLIRISFRLKVGKRKSSYEDI